MSSGIKDVVHNETARVLRIIELVKEDIETANRYHLSQGARGPAQLEQDKQVKFAWLGEAEAQLPDVSEVRERLSTEAGRL